MTVTIVNGTTNLRSRDGKARLNVRPRSPALAQKLHDDLRAAHETEIRHLALDFQDSRWRYAGLADLLHRPARIVALSVELSARSISARSRVYGVPKPCGVPLTRRQSAGEEGDPDALPVVAEHRSTRGAGRRERDGRRLQARAGIDERRLSRPAERDTRQR